MKKERLMLDNQRKQLAIAILKTFKRNQLPYTQLMPSAADFCEFTEVKSLIEQPADVDLNESSFEDLITCLPTIFEAWRTEKINSLIRLLPVEERRDVSSLDLATSVFTCLKCASEPAASCVYTFPDVLVHRCLTYTTIFDYNSTESETDPSVLLSGLTRRRTWSLSSIEVNPTLQAEVRRLIEAAGCDTGLKPNTATIKDMDELEVYFACVSCNSAAPRVLFSMEEGLSIVMDVFGWRMAVRYTNS